ncbi:MAG: hypothetical protein JJV95_00755 [Sulfurospirillum sp.]|nr:hypothetical protein [Sulfurospirillum sp.]
MKKSLLLASLLMLSSTVLLANDAKKWFIGGEFGGMDIGTEKSSETHQNPFPNERDISKNTQATYEAIKFGKYHNNGRFYGFYGHQNTKDDITSDMFGAGFDYIFKDFGEIMPFVGLQASYVKSKIDNTDLKTLGIDSLSGINLGINTGMIFPVMDSVEIEVGLRLLELELQNSVTKGTTQYEVELDGGTQYYLGVNYKF